VQEELATGIQGTLRRDKYRFHEHWVANALLWPIEKKIEWLGIVAEARKAYNDVKIAQG
jgi:hypothetical protein